MSKLTARSTVILEKLQVHQPLKKLFTSYKTRWFIIVSKISRHLT